MSIAIMLAFLMTLVTASSNVLLKKSFKESAPFFAVYISVIISVVFLWAATFLLVDLRTAANFKGVMVFVVIGSFAPTIVRSLTYVGIHKLGAGRAAPLRALTPFFAVIISMFFLKETPRPVIFLGLLLILAGIVLLSQKDARDKNPWVPAHFLYPLGAAVLAGLAANLRKYGLDFMPQPILASAVAATSSLIFLSVYVLFKYNIKEFFGSLSKDSFRLIIGASLLTAVGEIIDLSALMFGKVSLVIPIFAATPLAVVLLSGIFLRKHEVVSRRLWGAVALILLGIYFRISSNF